MVVGAFDVGMRGAKPVFRWPGSISKEDLEPVHWKQQGSYVLSRTKRNKYRIGIGLRIMKGALWP